VQFFFLDASALAKRYAPEVGTPLINHLLTRVPLDRLYLLNVGMAEVLSLLVRKKNAGQLSARERGPGVNGTSAPLFPSQRPFAPPASISVRRVGPFTVKTSPAATWRPRSSRSRPPRRWPDSDSLS
jgi:hypothetical protein